MGSKNKLMIFFVTIIFYILPCYYGEIKMIQVNIRHANRNPMTGELHHLYYLNDPYRNCDWVPDGPMELTNLGKQNAYKLGKFIREKYGELMGSTYSPQNVHFQAVQMSRAINTAQLIAAGIFRPTRDQIWNSKISWIPIPIYYEPIDEDILNYPLTFCENYSIDRIKSNAEVQKLLGLLSDIGKFYDYLSHHTGVNYTRTTQAWILYHQLAAEANLNLKLEAWTETIFPDGKLLDIVAVEYILQTYTERMKRLLGGVWIKIFSDHIDDLITAKNQRQGYFYVGNEFQIAAILNTLGVYKAHVPGYTSAIIFELHEIDKKLYVKITYRNEEKVLDLMIPGCENTICLLSTFKSVLKNVTLVNFNEDCGKRKKFSIM